MLTYLRHLSSTPQTMPARADQVKNAAGGFTFQVTPWTRLDRFLILGTDGGTYYASEKALSIDNAGAVLDCLTADGPRAVARIVEISSLGRAPKNEPAIFALAMAAGADPATRKAALDALPAVCRTGTHLFHFAAYVEQFRRWGRGLRRAVAGWYNRLSASDLALQIAKYAQRDGWSHRDLLRLAHPVAASPAHQAVFRWVAGNGSASLAEAPKRGAAADPAALPELLVALEKVKEARKVKEVIALIRRHGLTHEMVPTEWKNEPAVWEALLEKMPLTALVRNLAKMTSLGVLAPLGQASRTLAVCERLTDANRLKQARVHPLGLLAALKVYEQGKGERGKLAWKPVPQIVDALNQAFSLAFDAVTPTGKRHLVALDVSGSMTWGNLAGMPGVTPRLGSAAMSLVTLGVEPRSYTMGFSSTLVDVPLRPRMSLSEAVKVIERVPMGGTDCALPMVYATENKVPVDVFVIYTDNETWAGKVHPFQALSKYRERMGIAAKLVVVGMTATKFTIADPGDAGMLDVVGFDTAAPAVMADFARAA